MRQEQSEFVVQKNLEGQDGALNRDDQQVPHPIFGSAVVMFRVLLYSDYADLYQHALVCKLWLKVINSPLFMTDRLELATENELLSTGRVQLGPSSSIDGFFNSMVMEKHWHKLCCRLFGGIFSGVMTKQGLSKLNNQVELFHRMLLVAFNQPSDESRNNLRKSYNKLLRIIHPDYFHFSLGIESEEYGCLNRVFATLNSLNFFANKESRGYVREEQPALSLLPPPSSEIEASDVGSAEYTALALT